MHQMLARRFVRLEAHGAVVGTITHATMASDTSRNCFFVVEFADHRVVQPQVVVLRTVLCTPLPVPSTYREGSCQHRDLLVLRIDDGAMVVVGY